MGRRSIRTGFSLLPREYLKYVMTWHESSGAASSHLRPVVAPDRDIFPNGTATTSPHVPSFSGTSPGTAAAISILITPHCSQENKDEAAS
jgi:hypothetical protein